MNADGKIKQGVVLFARDVSKVAEFYRQVLGVTVLEDERSHVLLGGPGIEIVIHALPASVAARINIEDPPKLRQETPIKPAFPVADLEVVRAAAIRTGGGLKPLSGAWQIRGAVVLDGWDPEGNIVQFKQGAAVAG